MVKSQETRAARIAAAKVKRADALAAHKVATANVHTARQEYNRANHRAAPVRVSAHAIAHVIGRTIADGESVTHTVAPMATTGTFVSIRALAGKRVTFAREGDVHTARVAGAKPSRAALTAAERTAKRTATALTTARANVAKVSAKRTAKVSASA